MHQEFRNDLAKRLRSESDHTQRINLHKQIFSLRVGSEYQRYREARIHKISTSENTDRRQILFLNEREKGRVLDALAESIKTMCFTDYVPTRLHGTLLGKIFDEIEERSSGLGKTGYHDLYDFFSSIPVGVDLSEWCTFVAEKLSVEDTEIFDVIPQQEGLESGVMSMELHRVKKDPWADIGGLQFEKRVIPGERIGGNIRELRENQITEIQQGWLLGDMDQLPHSKLDIGKINIDSLKNVHYWSTNILGSPQPYSEQVERSDMEKLSLVLDKIDSGTKFRLIIDSEDFDPLDPDGTLFWTVNKDSRQQDHHPYAGALYCARLQLEEDDILSTYYPLFLDAGAQHPQLIESRHVVNHPDYGQVVIEGIGCTAKDLYASLKRVYGDQFVGLF